MEIKYGRIKHNGKVCGYATWTEHGDTVELIAPPYEPLAKLVNGKSATVTETDVLIWTEVAGWLGTDQLADSARGW